MATTKKATTVSSKEATTTTEAEETINKAEVKTEEKVENKYIILNDVSYPMEVTKEQYDEIRKTTNIVEIKHANTIYGRVVK